VQVGRRDGVLRDIAHQQNHDADESDQAEQDGISDDRRRRPTRMSRMLAIAPSTSRRSVVSINPQGSAGPGILYPSTHAIVSERND
jgi:hypothetical protein